MDPNNPAEVEAVLESVRRGNRDAFLTVVRAYHLLVRTYLCVHVYHMDDVDDLAQEVFLAAYRSLPALPAGADFGAWLRGIARHKVQNFRRAAGRHKRALDDFRETAARSADADLERGAAADRAEQIERLLTCVARLPDRLRRVVRATLEGDSPLALAGEMGTTVAALYTLRYRANQLLRTCMGEEGP